MTHASWSDAAQARFARLRAAGYTVTVEGHVATITGGPPPPTEPPTCPYTGTAMKPADWAPEGMTIWVPDLSTEV
jgi:hypothetical protein